MLTIFTGRIGDHNDHAMSGARLLGDRLADRWSGEQRRVGTPAPAPALDSDWRIELDAAHDPLRRRGGHAPRDRRTTPGRLRRLVRRPRRPAPARDTSSGYLGGMALSGPLGWWDTDLGGGIGHAVLAGTRDIDPAEQRLIDEHGITVVAPGPNFTERLVEAIGQRHVYIHLDCDVLEPGIVPTDYRVPDGLTLADLHAAMWALGRLDVIGIEVAELQAHPDGAAPDLDGLLEALAPVIDLVAHGRARIEARIARRGTGG